MGFWLANEMAGSVIKLRIKERDKKQECAYSYFSDNGKQRVEAKIFIHLAIHQDNGHWHVF